MTSEKVRQMQKFKEKAIKLEHRLKERKIHSSHKENNEFNLDGLSETARSSITTTITSADDGLSSHRSQENYDAKLKESEESMMILKDIIRRHSTGLHEKTTAEECPNSTYTTANRPSLCSEDKMKKLQKSETLIYDNSTNEVIKQMQDLENSYAPRSNDERPQTLDVDSHANLNYIHLKKTPQNLQLSGLNNRLLKSIPSICINPPTPLMGNRQICEVPIEEGKNDTFFVSDSKYFSQNCPDNSSSDDSFNSMLTHSDRKSKKPPPVPERTYIIPRSEKIHDLKCYNDVANVTAKIQQYEAISSDKSTPRATPSSSPDKNERGTIKLGPPSSIMSRSATSPSIKLNVSRPLCASDNSQFSPDNSLVRSSSFTLEAPSKALIDHMRQQSASSNKPQTKKITPTKPLNGDITRKISPTSRVHRDTIESKAKRVQKAELKPSRQKIQQKVSQHKLAQAAATISPYKASPTSFSTQGSSSSLYKTKKSPYDTQGYMKSSTQSHTSTAKFSSQAKKSPPSSASSTVSSQRTTKSRSSKPTTPTNTTANHKTSHSDKDVLTQMDKIQKEKFLRLLKQQEEEQRKLKEAFEMQQKLLIDQLNKEMSSTHIRSSPIIDSPGKILTKTSSNITQRSENLNESTRTSPESTLHQDYFQQSLTFSNDSLLLSSTATNLAQTTSEYPQVPSLSNLSSIDHSNANTSLDQSTYRTDATLTDDANTTPEGNFHKSAVGAGTNSASRRRLFPQEHDLTATPSLNMGESINPLNTISPNNSRFSVPQERHQVQQQNKGYGTQANNTNSNRRVSFNFN